MQKHWNFDFKPILMGESSEKKYHFAIKRRNLIEDLSEPTSRAWRKLWKFQIVSRKIC